MLGILTALLVPLIAFGAYTYHRWLETGDLRVSEALRLMGYQVSGGLLVALMMLPVLREAFQRGLVVDLASTAGLYMAGGELLIALVIGAAWHVREKIRS